MSAHAHAIAIVDALGDYVAPSGYEEQANLLHFIIHPIFARHAEETMVIPRTWVQSQKEITTFWNSHTQCIRQKRHWRDS